MASTNHKNKDLLKFQPFYASEIKNTEKKPRKTKVFTKKPKLINNQLSQALPFQPKKTKKPTRVTKRQILQNILPFPEAIGVSRRERTFKGSAETYNVEVMDPNSLGNSLFLAKRSIIDFLKGTLEEKRGFKYSFLAIVTLKNGIMQ